MKKNYYCKICHKLIGIQSGRYGRGFCRSCSKKGNKNPQWQVNRTKVNNSIRKKEYNKKYREIHKKEMRIRLKKYTRTPMGIYSHLKANAKKRNIEIDFNKSKFVKWYLAQKQECYYCKRSIQEIKQDTKERKYLKIRLSIDRKDNQKNYSMDNITLACCRCNMIKSDYFTIYIQEGIDLQEIQRRLSIPLSLRKQNEIKAEYFPFV